MMLRAFATTVLVLVISAADVAAEPAVRVTDGDGLRIGEERIRLWGIDAPELAQTCEAIGRSTPCGEDARFLLEALVAGGDVTCETKDIDRYRRTVARCFAGGFDLAGEMVRQGYALDWPRYSGGFYAEQEAEARAASRGMWSGDFTLPWDWRRNR